MMVSGDFLTAVVVAGTAVTAMFGLVGALLRGRINVLTDKIQALSDKIIDRDERLIKFIEARDARFLESAKRQDKQAEHRTAAVVAVLTQMQDKVSAGNLAAEHVKDIVNADQGWGNKLDRIIKHTDSMWTGYKLLEKVESYVLLLQDITKENQRQIGSVSDQMASCSGILKSAFGKRGDDNG